MASRAPESGSAGAHAARAVARLRTARGWDQQALADRLTLAGRQVSQPIVSRIESGTRRIDVDDLAALAAVLEVAMAALLPPEHRSAEGPAREDRDQEEAGPVETALRDDIAALGDLIGMEPSLAEMAYRLSHQMDGVRPVPCDGCGELVHVPDDARLLPALARELRATVVALLEGRAMDDDDDDLGDLGSVD